MIKGVIFDVDGTLIDSMGIWSQVDAMYLEKHGFQATEELSRQFSTMTMESSLQYMKDTFHIKDSIEIMLHDILSLVRDFYLHKVSLKSGMKELILTCHKNHIPMMICTSNEKSLIYETMERFGLADYFMYILTSDEVGSGKDNPEIYYKACQYMNSKPENTYVFEDAIHAASCAYKNHFQLIGVYDDYSQMYEKKIKEMSVHFIKEEKDIYPILESFNKY